MLSKTLANCAFDFSFLSFGSCSVISLCQYRLPFECAWFVENVCSMCSVCTLLSSAHFSYLAQGSYYKATKMRRTLTIKQCNMRAVHLSTKTTTMAPHAIALLTLLSRRIFSYLVALFPLFSYGKPLCCIDDIYTDRLTAFHSLTPPFDGSFVHETFVVVVDVVSEF